MSHFARDLTLAYVVVFAMYGTQGQTARADDEAQALPRVFGKDSSKIEAKRAELWKALTKALPKRFEDIDAYAENPALTTVLLNSQGRTLKFSLKSGKVEEILHMQPLPRINSVTFQVHEDGGDWILWHNGARASTIDDKVEGFEVADKEK